MKYFILFLIVFSLRLPYFYNSVIFSFFLLGVYALYLQKIKFNKDILILIGLQTFFLFYSLILPFILGTYDFTFGKNLLSLIIVTLTINLFFNIYGETITNINDAKRLFINIFIFQGVWILIVIIFPYFNKFNSIFQDQIVSSTVLDYDGKRGFALTFSPFFGVSVLFSFALFLFFNMRNSKHTKINFKDVIIFTLLVIGGTTSGRSFLVGLLIIISFNIFYDIFKKRFFTFKIIIIFFFTTTIFGIVLKIIDNNLFERLNDKILPFAFEIFYNLYEHNTLSTNSSNDTLSMYYPILGNTLFFGDFKYSYDEYFYYGDTDSGYMRPILFFGLLGFIPWILYFLYVAIYSIKKSNLSLMLIPVVLTFVYAIKGETIGYPSYLNIYFIYFYVYLSYSFQSK